MSIPQRTDPTPRRTTVATAGRPAVLVVEDDEATRELMMALLDMAGYAPEACADTAQALSSLRRRRYDLVLTDYSLPRQTGGAFLRQARLEGLLGATPALVITAHPDPAEAAGYEIVTKPFDVDHLMARIGARLGRAAAEADV